MADLRSLLTAHPIRKKPYNAIRFVRQDGNGVPLYRVGKEGREVGAAEALKIAMERYGAHCFHCKEWMPPQRLSYTCTRDHVRPRSDGGGSFLHNLVFACGDCNRGKGGQNLPGFSIEVGSEYLNALDEHLTRCIASLSEPGTKKGG